MEDKKKSSGCCSCDADFKEEIKHLENEAQAPSKAEHEKRNEELNAAFKEGQKK